MAKKRDFDFEEPVLPAPQVKCGECFGSNIFVEVVLHKEWRGNQEVDLTHDHYTCIDCGSEWDEYKN